MRISEIRVKMICLCKTICFEYMACAGNSYRKL